jgi:hypothetical protein
MRNAECGTRIDAVFNLHFTSASNKFINPHSAFRIPFEPGTVIALKVSHCIHIAFGSRVAPEAVWMVMV